MGNMECLLTMLKFEISSGCGPVSTWFMIRARIGMLRRFTSCLCKGSPLWGAESIQMSSDVHPIFLMKCLAASCNYNYATVYIYIHIYI